MGGVISCCREYICSIFFAPSEDGEIHTGEEQFDVEMGFDGLELCQNGEPFTPFGDDADMYRGENEPWDPYIGKYL